MLSCRCNPAPLKYTILVFCLSFLFSAYDFVNNAEAIHAYTTCDTSPSTPYASTIYAYDVLGNLTGITDANQKNTSITYDTLGRKKNMTDPDMGYWQYSYYPDDSLYSVTDAKNQTITYGIDVLNRPIGKHYPAGSGMTDVVFNYDEPTSTNPKGRLTSMTDGSGSATYHYDLSGRRNKTVKRVNNTDYTISTAYDGLDRLASITYPDNESIYYYYDKAGNLTEITGYAVYDEYNALGQPGKLYFANGIVTSYWYYPNNYRLLAIKTDRLQDTLLYRTYSYDNKGNLSLMQDLASTVTETASPSSTGYTYWPDNAHRLQTAGNGRTYLYDSNGNITSDGQRTITYTADNMPQTVTIGGVTTSFVYDGDSNRVKKAGQPNRIYIGKLHECADGCGNYIFARNTRIAKSIASGKVFYHPDHLGSTSLATDDLGNQIESIYYYPFGEKRSDSGDPGGGGSINLNHKYTSQELDYETGLYNYGARFYDQEIGRFISPDSIVPYPADPQSMNRYSYVQNNPVSRIDPSGNFDFEFGGFNFCIFGCDGGNNGGGSGGSSFSSGADYAMRFYQSPNSYNYNFSASSSWSNGSAGSGGYSTLTFGTPADKAYASSIASNYNYHDAIGAGGMIISPLNLADAGAYALEGDYGNAALSTVSAIPFAKAIGVLGTVGKASGGFVKAQKLLSAPKMADHHIFSKQYVKFFSSRGIDIDAFTVSIPQNITHLKGIHGSGINNLPGKWNARWGDFIRNNPNASTKDIYQFGGKLMDEYGLSGLSIHPYKW